MIDIQKTHQGTAVVIDHQGEITVEALVDHLGDILLPENLLGTENKVVFFKGLLSYTLKCTRLACHSILELYLRVENQALHEVCLFFSSPWQVE